MGNEKRRTNGGTELVADPDPPERDGRTHTLPPEVVEFDDDLFKRICNHLGSVGILERPNRTTCLTLDIEAGTNVRVTHVEEETEEGWTRRPLLPPPVEWVESFPNGIVSEEEFLEVYGEETAKRLTREDRLQYSPSEALFYVEEDHGGE